MNKNKQRRQRAVITIVEKSDGTIGASLEFNVSIHDAFGKPKRPESLNAVEILALKTSGFVQELLMHFHAGQKLPEKPVFPGIEFCNEAQVVAHEA